MSVLKCDKTRCVFRFGIISSVKSIRKIAAGEEVSVDYRDQHNKTFFVTTSETSKNRQMSIKSGSKMISLEK